MCSFLSPSLSLSFFLCVCVCACAHTPILYIHSLFIIVQSVHTYLLFTVSSPDVHHRSPPSASDRADRPWGNAPAASVSPG